MYLLDTNVLSEFLRRRPIPRVAARAREEAADDLWTSVVCVMELRFGALRRPDSGRFWARLEREILERVKLAPFAEAEALRAGDVLAALEREGRRIGVPDAQIAATALVNGMTVVTANTRHFERVAGLACEDWSRTAD